MRASTSDILDDIYPDSDGKPMAETQVHVALLASLYGLLEYWLKPRGIYLAGNMFLYYKEGDPKARRTPDLMAVKGVNVEHKRRSFKTWVEKAVPCWVLELTSKKTAKEDRGPKKRLYRRLGVREYFMFDPLNDYLPRQLMGFRLSGGSYQRMEREEDGGLTSKEMGLRFVPDGNDLLVFEAKTGKQLLHYRELQGELERHRRATDKRIAELEAELARVKSAPRGKHNGRR
ncbi:MAG: Uma2 family endonuclease [Gemmataceae bacterium]|nr:Uma2 family endonuclease [Gemmataceae bacterium]